LGDGISMPLIGVGTQYGFAEDGHHRGRVEDGSNYVALALRTGFRLLDTARGYATETHVMRGIEASGIDRRQLFVVSKAWPGSDHAPGPDSSRSAIAESAARLGGYVDLFLVHQPVAGWQDLWRSLEEAKDEGQVRAIGVSNFGLEHLEELHGFARHLPAANQIHLHPFVYDHYADIVRVCEQHGITIIAFPRSPWQLGQGSAVDAIAASCGRSRVQVMLRWAVDRGFAVIPLSTNQQHLEDNFAIREFRLTAEQVRDIDQLGGRNRVRHHIDELRADGVVGWAFASAGLVRIRILVDGTSVGEATRGLQRADVQQAYPDQAGALGSGFEFRFPEGCLRGGVREVRLAFELGNGEQAEVELPVPTR